VAPHIIKKEKHFRKEEALLKKKIIRIGTKRKPKPTKKERFLTGDIQTCEFGFKPARQTTGNPELLTNIRSLLFT